MKKIIFVISFVLIIASLLLSACQTETPGRLPQGKLEGKKEKLLLPSNPPSFSDGYFFYKYGITSENL
jgi:hypothetical protein